MIAITSLAQKYKVLVSLLYNCSTEIFAGKADPIVN